ncbi:MAG TPA: acyl-CoA dehydrogenase family protein [Candidatus Binataceae bacterium]|nr:acyl-CoA dehydrogenase family protein [Candidatus Binataceae bacterium]
MIGFDLSDEQKMIRETVAAFAIEEIRPAARPADESGTIPLALIAKGWELGLVRGAIPEEFGGYGDARSAVTGAITVEELAYGDLAIAMHMLAPQLLAYPLIEAGSPSQRAQFLPQFAVDAFVPASAALMEPRFDFEPSLMETTARRDGGGFILNGDKCYVPLAAQSASMLIYAATDREKGYAGVDAFIVPRNTAGLAVSAREKNMGLKALETFEMKLTDCRVGSEARLGGESGINFTRQLSQSRVAMAAMAVGVARAAYDYARAYAKERKAFGVPIATKQAIAFMLAEMAIELDATRLLVWDAASRLDKGDNALKESSQARNYAAQSCLAIADNALQVLGGHGYIREHPVELWLRNARCFGVLEGLATA